MNYHIFGIFCNSYGSVIEFIRDIKGSCKPHLLDIVRVGIHKILIHLQVYKGAEQEAYSERLYDVAADSSKSRAKLLETAIELSSGSFYEIQASIFPSRKIMDGLFALIIHFLCG